MRPPGYEPGELPTAPLRDVISGAKVQFFSDILLDAAEKMHGNCIFEDF